MTKNFLRLFIAVIALILTQTVFAQYPNWTKKAASSIFKITTFSAEGNEIGTANGFYIDENQGVAPYTIFDGAASAIVVDASGKELKVESMVAANDIYDIARFNIPGGKSSPLTVATTNQPAEKDRVWALLYAKKGVNGVQGDVEKAETFRDTYKYFTITFPAKMNDVGCPVFNNEGEVIGMLQMGAAAYDNSNYAISAEFIKNQKLSGFSVNDKALQRIGIKTALPDEEEQAFLFLTLAGTSMKGEKYRAIVDDFIAKFPKSADGYAALARSYTETNNYEEAIREYEHAYSLNPQQIYKNQESKMYIDKALWHFGQEQYRDAVLSLNTAEELVTDTLDDAFYFTREQAEVRCRMYQQALSDLDSAIYKARKKETYMAEKARVHYLVSQFDEGIKTCEACIEKAPDYDVVHLILGLCLIGKEEKEKGLESLRKAQELGNAQAAALIEKYQ